MQQNPTELGAPSPALFDPQTQPQQAPPPPAVAVPASRHSVVPAPAQTPVSPLSQGGADFQPAEALQTGASVGAIMGDKATIFRRTSTGKYYQFNPEFEENEDFVSVVVDVDDVLGMVTQ